MIPAVPSPRLQAMLRRFTWGGLGVRIALLIMAIATASTFALPALALSVGVYGVALLCLRLRAWNLLIVILGIEWGFLIHLAILVFGWSAGFGQLIYALPVSTLLFAHIPPRWRLALALLPVLSYLPVALFTVPPAPEITLTPTALKSLAAANTFAFFAFVAVVVWEALQKLAREKERATGLAEARTRLIANLSHEIKTPLAAMQTTVQSALTRPREPEEYRDALALCERNTRQLGSLVGRMLDSVTVGLGGMTPRRQEVDVPSLLQRSVDLHQPLLSAKSGRIELVAAGPFTCWTDPELLAVIVNNLLANAVRYSPPGQPVRVTLDAPKHGAASIAVRDEGPGIAAEDQVHIFDAFYRVDKSRSRSEGSAGLGLAIAAEFAGVLGCTITVDSAPGAGSTFIVRLPDKDA